MSRDVAPKQQDQREVALTLAGPTPKTLGFTDQAAFWANLGVSLLGFSGALTVLAPAGFPQLSILAAVAATVVGTVLGSVMVGLSAVPGARTGAPSMVLLRGLFGTRLSYVPTVLNVLQLVGWGTFELLVIAQGLEAIFHGGPHWLYVVLVGAVTTLLTLRPLGMLRLLRRYVTIAVAIAMVYLFVQVLRHPLPDLSTGSWRGFWAGADAALAVAVSWIPVASDYSRHSRSTGAAFAAASVGYSVTQVLTYVLGLLALALVAGDPQRAFDPFLAVPLGAVFFGVLVLREVDQSFANVYSTAVSLQNVRPTADRRVLSIGVGLLVTVLASTLDIGQYAGFLTLIGSVFVPLFGVLAADYFLRGRGRSWDLSANAPSRWGMLLAWATGLVTYQLINPGSVGWWSQVWTKVQHALGITPTGWTSASLLSFVVAAAIAHLANVVGSRRREAVWR
ncbi:MAG TPA: cytosine permease [Pseudonocardiaceae bacterium]|nr:cytosine permease [Pseudonocardiaceae bacterium]